MDLFICLKFTCVQIKIPKVHIPTHIYSDDTPDPPSGLSIENGHVFRKPHERLCNPVSRFLPPDEYFDQEPEAEAEEEAEPTTEVVPEGTEIVEEEDDECMDDYMFTRAEYNRLKYESPLIKQLKRCQVSHCNSYLRHWVRLILLKNSCRDSITALLLLRLLSY